MLCYAMLCYAMLCYAKCWCYAMAAAKVLPGSAEARAAHRDGGAPERRAGGGGDGGDDQCARVGEGRTRVQQLVGSTVEGETQQHGCAVVGICNDIMTCSRGCPARIRTVPRRHACGVVGAGG
jgi:hypothetical protein